MPLPDAEAPIATSRTDESDKAMSQCEYQYEGWLLDLGLRPVEWTDETGHCLYSLWSSHVTCLTEVGSLRVERNPDATFSDSFRSVNLGQYHFT